MVIDPLEGTPYAHVAVMNSKETHVIKLDNPKQGEIRKIKLKLEEDEKN